MAMALERAFLIARWYYPGTDFSIIPQLEIDQYRVDFSVSFSYYDEIYDPKGDRTEAHHKSCIVECDGHDYYERTRKQAQHDKARDRYLQSKGYHVLHFTGSEIYRSPMKCAVDVLQFLIGESTPEFCAYLGWDNG
ncbi:MAG: DUF559 domain-containing protein [Actinobacteria bacterium]|nr:DUF559 domain-containing protein [Actinomycetota bacterium]